MKKLLLIPLLALLTGCVTYYYPARENPDGVYYAAGQPSYQNQPAYAGDSYYADDTYYPEDSYYSDYSSSYAYSYPWWSLDYFYLGGGWYRNSPSFGFSIGFGGAPYYAYNQPFIYVPYRYAWYTPYYAWHPFYHPYAWNSYYWQRRYHDYHDSHYPGHRDGHWDRDHYATLDRDHAHQYGVRPDERNQRGPGSAVPRDYEDRGPGHPQPAGTMPLTDRVTMAPDQDGRVMVIRNRSGAKSGPSRLDPVRISPADASSSERRAAQQSGGTFSVVSRPDPVSREAYSPRADVPAYNYRRIDENRPGQPRTVAPATETGSVTFQSPPPSARRTVRQTTEPVYRNVRQPENPVYLSPTTDARQAGRTYGTPGPVSAPGRVYDAGRNKPQPLRTQPVYVRPAETQVMPSSAPDRSSGRSFRTTDSDSQSSGNSGRHAQRPSRPDSHWSGRRSTSDRDNDQ